MDYQVIINKYYPEDNELRHILLVHSRAVADKALFPRHARVCERHTGAGITRSQIIAQKLPLPQQDFLPETMEEKVICYADKFFSKSHLDEEKTIEQAIASLSKFGEEGVARFREWVKMF